MVVLSLTRRQFVLGSLAGVGLLMLPSSESFGVTPTPTRRRAGTPRIWLRGNPRMGCSHYPGTEWNVTDHPVQHSWI
ncbi:MAG: hypothetical protein GF341_12210 [candidate division Zixibacteria bacterium]|nr:hypothetical protein [candidate division Zixibacteria bacterium]